MKTDLFQSCGHCWVFQSCWHIEYSTFTVSSFKIWNSSTGILTFHFRMSGSRWVTTPSWLSGWWSSFLYRSSVYSCHFFLITSVYVIIFYLNIIPFLSFIEPIFAWNVPLVSLIFMNRSLVFPILLFSSISLHLSLRRLSYVFLLFFGSLHSDAYIFPFLLCL